MSIKLGMFSILAIRENKRRKLAIFLLANENSLDFISEMANIDAEMDKNDVVECLSCAYCMDACPSDDVEGLTPEALDGTKITSRNKRFFPLYCANEDGFVKMHWLCNRIAFDDPTT